MAQSPERLLGEDDPAPVRVLRPRGRSDFFLTADHAGRAIPQRLGNLGLPDSELRRHIAWDIGIAGVTEMLAQALDATAVLQAYSRLVIDCNRNPGWASSIPQVSELTAIPGNETISPAEREARRREIFSALSRAYRRAARPPRRRRAAHRADRDAQLHPSVQERDPHRRYRGSLQPRCALAQILLDLLRAERDLSIGDNAPYAITDTSDYTVPTHGEARGLPHVEIEIRQDLIGGVAGQAAWASRLARLLPLADARLRATGG